jgi:hypothetical protein
VALVALLIFVAYLAGDEAGWTRMLPLAAFVGVLVLLVWRHVPVGVDVGDRGIRVRTMWRRLIVPWSSVQRVYVVEDPQYRNWMLTIVTQDGRRIPTPVCQRAFRIARPAGPLGCVMLTSAELEALGHALDAMAVEKNRAIRV